MSWGDPIDLKDDGQGGFFASIRERIMALGFAQQTNVTFNGTTRNFASVLSPDASTFAELVWAKASGSIWVLLGSSTDFAHFALAHNVTMDQTSGLFTSTPDSTATSYLEIWTDAGLHNIYQAPATGVVGNPPVFVLTWSLNMITGVMFPVQAVTGSAPAYVKGGMYFDLTLNKMRIGGATAWETVTSA